MPSVSIIITAYNIRPYIEECLNDIVAQTLQDIEIIVVDDGSSDGTRDIIDAFHDPKGRIKKILLDENTIGGVGTAANHGLDVATGDYIGFADGDDRYDPTMFEALYTAAQDFDADLAMCDYYVMDTETGDLSAPADSRCWKDYLSAKAVTLDTDHTKALLKFIAVPWRKLYRRSLLEDNAIRFPVGDYFFEDNPFHWATCIAADRIAFVPEQFCKHRVNREGQTMGSFNARLFGMFEHHTTIRKQLLSAGVYEDYSDSLAAWLIAQATWISARCPQELRPQLLKILTSCFRSHSAKDMRRALEGVNKRNSGAWVALMARTGNPKLFDQAFLEYKDRSTYARFRFKAQLYPSRFAKKIRTEGIFGLGSGRRITRLGRIEALLLEILEQQRILEQGNFGALEILDDRIAKVQQDVDQLKHGAEKTTKDSGPLRS